MPAKSSDAPLIDRRARLFSLDLVIKPYKANQTQQRLLA